MIILEEVPREFLKRLLLELFKMVVKSFLVEKGSWLRFLEM
jgi:hypothetical protein